MARASRRPARWLRASAALALVTVLTAAVYLASLTLRIRRQSMRDEARPADVIVVLGAAEYSGRPSPVLKARLDHAFNLYLKGVAPRIFTTGGAGGDPRFTEAEVGRNYLIGLGVPSEAITVEPEGDTTVHTLAAGERDHAANEPALVRGGERRVPHLSREEGAAGARIPGGRIAAALHAGAGRLARLVALLPAIGRIRVVDRRSEPVNPRAGCAETHAARA